jgi:hypothetical protein
MPRERDVLKRALGDGLSGKGAHVEAQHLFAGLDWEVAGALPDGVSHSVFQLLNHMTFWQDWALKWLDGQAPPLPNHAAGSWPGGAAPGTRAEWEAAVGRFQSGLKGLRDQVGKADPLAKRGRTTRLSMLRTMASHNSYHAGQVVMLRKLFRSWPPPSGGLTW